jgi:hypothetical protein
MYSFTMSHFTPQIHINNTCILVEYWIIYNIWHRTSTPACLYYINVMDLGEFIRMASEPGLWGENRWSIA